MTRKAGVGTARRGPPLHPRGLRGRVVGFGAGPGTVRWGRREPQAARRPPLALASGARHAEWTRLLCGAPGARGVRELGVPVCVLASSHRGGK